MRGRPRLHWPFEILAALGLAVVFINVGFYGPSLLASPGDKLPKFGRVFLCHQRQPVFSFCRSVSITLRGMTQPAAGLL